MPEISMRTIVLSLSIAAAAWAQARGGRGPNAPEAPQPPRSGALPQESSAITHHSIRIGNEQINYTATAAKHLIKDDNGMPKASMFFAAYSKDGVTDPTRRPIAFIYNGGPGSASLFTHMG